MAHLRIVFSGHLVTAGTNLLEEGLQQLVAEAPHESQRFKGGRHSWLAPLAACWEESWAQCAWVAQAGCNGGAVRCRVRSPLHKENWECATAIAHKEGESELSVVFGAALDDAWSVPSAVSLSVLPGFIKGWPVCTPLTGKASCQSQVLCCDFTPLLN